MAQPTDGSQEIELKFELEPEALDRLEERLTVRAGGAAPSKARTLVSVYYDTPGRDLRKAGMTLRVRQDGKKRVQTVKCELEGLAARGEWETDLDSEALDLAALKHTPLGPMIEDAGPTLKPVFATRIRRVKRLIREPAGEIEAALDRGQIEAGGRVEAVCELELELMSGEPDALYGLARRLAESEPMRLSFESKAERGFRLLEQTPVAARPGQCPALADHMTVAQALAAIGAAALRQIIANAQILRQLRRPEALHQTRVGIRRLRTAMKLFEAVCRDKDHGRLYGELKWLAGELDQARDLDVMIAETFEPAAEQFSRQRGLDGLGERLRSGRDQAYDRALAALDSARGLALPLDLAAWLERGAWRDPADPLHPGRAGAPIGPFAGAAIDRLRRQIKRRGKDLARLDPELRHKLRIRAKRLRYAVEFFASLYGHELRQDRFLKRLKALQDTLGALNDMEVAREQGLGLAEAGGRAAGHSAAEGARQAFAAGLMVGARAGSEKTLIKRADGLCAKLLEAEPFWRG